MESFKLAVQKEPILRIHGKCELFISMYLLSAAEIAARALAPIDLLRRPLPRLRLRFYLHKALGKVLSGIDCPVLGCLLCSCADHLVFSWKAVLQGVHPKLSGEKVKLNCRCLSFIQRHVGLFFFFFLLFYFMRIRLLSFSEFESFCSLHCG